jgi:hypothetical protein
MDIDLVLKTTFAVPTIAPDWEADLLRQLGASDTAGVARNSCEADFRSGLLLPSAFAQQLTG